MARITVQITTPSNNRITVSPGVSALSSVQLYLNELVDVDTSGGQDGYVLTQQADGSFAMNAIVTRLDGLSDTNIVSPGAGDALVYDDQSGKWVPGGVKSVNGQEGDVVITIPSPPPTPGVSGLADTNITNLQDDQIIRYDSNSGNWLNEDLEALPAGGTTGQALVKATNTDYDVQWADIAIDVQYHNRYATTAETLRSGATETVELYFFAQADGNGLAESAQSDTATTGYDIRRKLYYSEAAQADPDTGTWIQFATIPDDTTFASAKAKLLAYLKERTGGTVPISLKMTWEEVAEAPSFTGLLNESYGSGAAAAYSVRRLNGNYTGAAIQVERSSDNTTQDIGFDVDGDLDESALTTFCTGTVCKVRTWYDQSVTGGTGSGNDAVQTVHANQPTIYTGGAIVKRDGKVAILGNGSAALQLTQIDFDSDLLFVSLFEVYISDSIVYGTTNNFFGSAVNSYFTIRSRHTDGVTQSTLNCVPGAALNPQQKILFGLNKTGTASNNVSFTLNGISKNTATSAVGTNASQIGIVNGAFQEIILYDATKSSGDQASIESNIGDYFTQNTPLLDTYTGAAAAYSLRKLRTAYTGSAIRVRRASDNTEQDIGFNVFGELDTVSLASFCSGTDGFVKTWYDQSGNANDATQTTAANQPKIYDSVTGVVTENGKPAVSFDGGDNLPVSGTIYASPATVPTKTMSSVMTIDSGADDILLNFNDGTTIISYSYNRSSSNALQVRSYDGSTIVDKSATVTTGQQFGTFSEHNLSTASTNLYFNSTLATGTSAGRGDFATQGLSVPFASIGSMIGTMQEIVFFDSDQSSNRTGIESNINTFYSIY